MEVMRFKQIKIQLLIFLSINSNQLLEITFEVNGVSINAQIKARTKKAKKELKNKKRINSPVLELTFKNSAAFRSSFPAKPIEILNNYY